MSANPPHSCLSVVIPAYNEEKTLFQVVEQVLTQAVVSELIIVDDASSDGTWAVMQKIAATHPKIRLFQHSENRGKGAALRTGLENVTSDYVIIQDADLEYDPAEYVKLLNPILQGRADVVFGSRFIGSSERRVLYFWHSVGNSILTTMSNMFTNLTLTDMETCYKLFRREIIQKVTIEENRFGFEPEITAKVAKMGVRIFEIPVSYNGRTYADGKKICWRDGFSAIRCIIKYSML